MANEKMTVQAVLMNEDLRDGNICPICGGEKSKGARICTKCHQALGGNNASKTIDKVLEALVKANQGFNPDNPRPAEIVFKAVGQVRVDADAKPYKGAKPGDSRLWGSKSLEKNGYLHCTFFGCEESDKGRLITALILLKKRDGKPYLAVVKLFGVTSDAELCFSSQSFEGDLPHKPVKGVWQDPKTGDVKLFDGFIGFRRVGQQVRATEAA